jgi:hypothetical protein
MAIVVLVVIAIVAVFAGMIAWYRRPPQLTRRLRSTSFSRRRSDAIRQAAALDVAEILEGDGYPVRDSPGQESEL